MLFSTGLLWATKYGYINIAKLLIKIGADVNILCQHGSTTLHLAVINGHTKAVFMLLIYGATLNDKDRNKINQNSSLKKCLTAFEQIKAMPNLGKLIEMNKSKDKKEKVISQYMDDYNKKMN